MKQSAKQKMKAWKNAQKNPVSFADDENKHSQKLKGDGKRYGKVL